MRYRRRPRVYASLIHRRERGLELRKPLRFPSSFPNIFIFKRTFTFMFMYLILILGALAFSSSTLFEKIVLKNKNVKITSYFVGVFLSAIIVMLPFLFFFGKIDSQAFSFKNLIILFFVVLLSIVANLFYFYALKWEKVTVIEPVLLLEPLFIVLLAFIFFKSERNFMILIPSLIATLTLIFSHLKKYHLQFNKFLVAGIFSSLFFAIELLISNLILDYYSPLSLYFVRGFFVFLFSALIFRPTLSKELNKKERSLIFLTGGLWVIYRIILYFGYSNWGVIFTTLILMLAPIFVYLFAFLFLKEKLTKRNIIAMIIILACVIFATQ